MIDTSTEATGLKLHIKRFQKHVYDRLWLPEGSVYKSYGLVYRNYREGKYYADYVFGDSQNNEYQTVFPDDAADVVSFFGTSEQAQAKARTVAKVHFVVMANVRRLYPEAKGRADDLVRVAFSELIGKVLYGFHLQSVLTGMDAVSEYTGLRENLSASANMQPMHLFRFNFSISYKPNLVPLKL